MAMNKYLSIITLNVNELNAPIKRHRVAEWIRKHNMHICCIQETLAEKKIYIDCESEGMGKISQANAHEKKSG